MEKALVKDYRQTEEYQALVEECRATITERVRNSREELIIGHGEVGQKICNDPFYRKHGKGNSEFSRHLFADIGIGERTGYYCVQFYEEYIQGKFDDVCTAMQTLFPQEGKNISWNKIKTKYLTKTTEPVVESKVTIKVCGECEGYYFVPDDRVCTCRYAKIERRP